MRQGTVITRDDVRAVETPRPTRTWNPVPHDWVLDTVEAALQQNKFRVVQEHHELTCHNDQYFCRLGLANGNANPDYIPAVGIRNSHNKKFSVGICWGAHVTVCSNLVFSGEHMIQRKHVGPVRDRIEAELADSIGQLQGMYNEQEADFQEYRRKLLTKDESYLLLMSLLEVGVLSGSQLDLVRKQLAEDNIDAGPRSTEERISRHGPFDSEDSYVSAWEVLQAVSSVLRDRVLEGSQAEKTILLAEALKGRPILCRSIRRYVPHRRRG